MHDEFVMSTASVPYVEDNMSEYVGIGRYSHNSSAFPKAIAASFDSIAVDAGTRVTIYRDANFQGEVLWDKVGPAIVVNVKWKDTVFFKQRPYGAVLGEPWKEPLNTIFPQNVREFSSSDMHLWNTGSLVIQGMQPIPRQIKDSIAEYALLMNPTC